MVEEPYGNNGWSNLCNDVYDEKNAKTRIRIDGSAIIVAAMHVIMTLTYNSLKVFLNEYFF